jgi:hypothetical protein
MQGREFSDRRAKIRFPPANSRQKSAMNRNKKFHQNRSRLAAHNVFSDNRH